MARCKGVSPFDAATLALSRIGKWVNGTAYFRAGHRRGAAHLVKGKT